MIAFPAIFHTAAEGGYWVEFPDIPGCHTQGESLEEAKNAAKEALSLMLEHLDSRKRTIPESSNITGENIFYIEPETSIAFAITLKKERKKRGLTQKDVAKKLGVNWTAYQRIENPRKTNPTLATIIKLEKVFEKQLITL